MSEKSEAKDFNSRNYIGFRHNTIRFLKSLFSSA